MRNVKLSTSSVSKESISDEHTILFLRSRQLIFLGKNFVTLYILPEIFSSTLSCVSDIILSFGSSSAGYNRYVVEGRFPRCVKSRAGNVVLRVDWLILPDAKRRAKKATSSQLFHYRIVIRAKFYTHWKSALIFSQLYTLA